jgi:peptidoglycan hydrolase-like protein with peptidoglycan-binding domain
VPPLASPPTLAQQPPVATPPSGYWSLDEIFSASTFSGYSKNGRAYLLFEAQAALKEKSHYTAPVDGQVGKGTHKAITSFQAANGLAPTGQLDSSTISALGLSSMDDKSTWTPPQRRRRPSTRSGGSVAEDDSGWWRTNVADPFKRAFGR